MRMVRGIRMAARGRLVGRQGLLFICIAAADGM